MKTFFRHLAVIAVAGLAVLLLGWMRSNWDPMHRWNRAFGDTAFVLFSLTMALGPLVVLDPRIAAMLPLRRELGIYSALLAAVHAAITFVGWFGLDLLQVAGFAFHPKLQRYVLVEHALGLANWLGAFALLPALGLAAISNEKALRLLGPRTWKHVQAVANGVWILAVLHTGYFLFMHFQHFHVPDPRPNPVTWFLVILVIGVQVLRWLATAAVWRRGRRSWNEAAPQRASA